jgi:hypothetical protein
VTVAPLVLLALVLLGLLVVYLALRDLDELGGQIEEAFQLGRLAGLVLVFLACHGDVSAGTLGCTSSTGHGTPSG